jgi:hypothetical protein
MKNVAMRQAAIQRPADINIQIVQQTASGKGDPARSRSAASAYSTETWVIATPLTQQAPDTSLLKILLIHNDKLEGNSGY